MEPIKLMNVEEAALGGWPAGDGVGFISTVPVGGASAAGAGDEAGIVSFVFEE